MLSRVRNAHLIQSFAHTYSEVGTHIFSRGVLTLFLFLVHYYYFFKKRSNMLQAITLIKDLFLTIALILILIFCHSVLHRSTVIPP